MNELIPRVSVDALDPRARTAIAPIVERVGYFGEFFEVIGGYLPEALVHFMSLGSSVRRELPDNLNEVAALTVTSALGADYERIQHERLSARHGHSPQRIDELTGGPGPRPTAC